MPLVLLQQLFQGGDRFLELPFAAEGFGLFVEFIGGGHGGILEGSFKVSVISFQLSVDGHELAVDSLPFFAGALGLEQPLQPGCLQAAGLLELRADDQPAHRRADFVAFGCVVGHDGLNPFSMRSSLLSRSCRSK
jgi:hypothetical protein